MRRIGDRGARPGPALAATAALALALGGLALLLDAAAGGGVPRGVARAAGYAYFAILVGAPLVIWPAAYLGGCGVGVRVALSLVPGGLWWASEVRLRLAHGHDLAQALYLALSPVNALHLAVVGLAMLAAEALCRLLVGRARAETAGARPLGFGRSALGALAVLALAFGAAWSFVPYSAGYHALFGGAPPPAGPRPGPLPPGSVAPRPAGELPNLVVILSDDHRWDAAGHMGHPFVETPALDRLAAEGVRFENAFVTTSLCSPSRASFLTGVYPERHGVYDNTTPWSDANRTFFEPLAQAGYATAFIGKWHMPGHLPVLRGVDHFVTFTAMAGQGVYEDCPLVVDGREEPSRKRYITEELTDRALAWMGEHADRPFALYLSHKSVHAPFTPAPAERGRYADRPVPLPPGAHPWVHWTDAQYVHLNTRPLGDQVRRYLEAVASMDREIGRLLARIDELGLRERTLVVYTSDNGYLWGEHGLVDKRWPYEESIRVPFLVRWPGTAEAGVRRPELVLNVDLAPTLLDAAGLPPDAAMQGRSLVPLLRGRHPAWRQAFVYRYRFEAPYPAPGVRALRTDRYLYADYDLRPPELFDLRADPAERHDLAARAPDRARALAGRLREALAPGPQPSR